MDIGTTTFLIVLALFSLMAIGVPLGATTLLVSICTSLIFFGPPGLILVASNVFSVLEKYPLIAVPFFVFMANMLERAGLAETLFDSMAILGGKLRGGVAVQTCVVGVVLAAMSGIAGGEIVLLGLIALPQMFRLGYDRKMSIGIIAAAGSLAIMIPPSIVMIVYGLTAQVSVTELFTGAIVPGLLLAGMYITYVLVRCKLNPALGPAYDAPEAELPFHRRLPHASGLVLPLLLIFGVLGSIYGGIATVTEAAAVGAVGALLVAAIRRRLTVRVVREALYQTTLTVGSILWVVIGAVGLIGTYNLIGGTSFLNGVLTGLDVPPLVVILAMMGIIMILGTFMDWIAILFITVPIFAPVVVQLGYDPVWFGILFAMNIQFYMLSPPFGPACFYLKSVAPPDVTLGEIFASVWPFMILQVIALIAVMLIPDIALWLPRTLLGS